MKKIIATAIAAITVSLLLCFSAGAFDNNDTMAEAATTAVAVTTADMTTEVTTTIAVATAVIPTLFQL